MTGGVDGTSPSRDDYNVTTEFPGDSSVSDETPVSDENAATDNTTSSEEATPAKAPVLPKAAGTATTKVTVGSAATKRRGASSDVSAPTAVAPAPKAVRLPVLASQAPVVDVTTPADVEEEEPLDASSTEAEPTSEAVADVTTEDSSNDQPETSESTDEREESGRSRRSRGRRGRGRGRRRDNDSAQNKETDKEAESASPESATSAQPTAATQQEAATAGEAPEPGAPLAPPAPASALSPFLLFQPPVPVPAAQTPPPAQEQPDEDSAEESDSETSEDAESNADSDDAGNRRRRRRRGGRGRRRRSDEGEAEATNERKEDPSDESGESEKTVSEPVEDSNESSSRRRRRRRPRRGGDGESEGSDKVAGVKGSTRLEAKRQRRRDGRESQRKRHVVSEAEFLARRESVERQMVVREGDGRTQVAVVEDGVLVEHYVARKSQKSMIGNVYVGRVQNVLPSMEAAFVDIGKGRNAVLYAGEVNWDAAGLEGQPRRIESALKSGDSVLVQVTKDPIGHKGPRLTSQISLPGRYLVYVPGQSMTGISRKLPDSERTRLKKILKAVVPSDAGVIVRTAAEGASEDELRRDVERLQAQWEKIQKKSKSANPPTLLYREPSLAIKIIRDVFNEDFTSLTVAGDEAWNTVSTYVSELAPDLADRVHPWDPSKGDVFQELRLDEQIMKALDRKVYLPSGGSLVIDRTEAMTVVDVNTGKFTGSGGNLEATVTKNNLEAAEEIVRQLRLRDIGGIIVVDFIDMVLEANRDLVLRRLLECLSRDRTKHQVAEVTSLGLVQMTRKRIGQGLLEVFSEPCPACDGRGVKVHEIRGFSESSTKASEEEEKELFEQRRSEQAEAVARMAAAAARKGDDDGAEGESGDFSEPASEDVAEPAPEKTSSRKGGRRRRRGQSDKRSKAEPRDEAGEAPVESPSAEGEAAEASPAMSASEE